MLTDYSIPPRTKHSVPFMSKEDELGNRRMLGRTPGHHFVYDLTNPPAPFADQPGKFWIRTNLSGTLRSNGVIYGFLVVVTNYGPRLVTNVVGSQVTAEQYEASWRRMRDEDAKLGLNSDIRARESELKTKARGLKRGMTAQEVLDLLGPPSVLTVRTRIGPNAFGEEAISPKDLKGRESRCYMAYSPYPTFNRLKRHFAPYESLEIGFDKQGNVWDFQWLRQPGLGQADADSGAGLRHSN